MSATEFTPERSDAIRQLLLDVVADEPRRRRRFHILVTSVLASVAIVLAGGTAALALTGVIRFDSAPAPVGTGNPTATPTATPSATPSPTPTSTAAPRAIQVQSTPIQAEDVRSLPAHPSWSLDLPGETSTCQQHYVYNIADGLALFTIGSNMGTESRAGCTVGHGDTVLAMVDTVKGSVLWSREWKWEGDAGMGTFLSVLGTSNRAFFVDESGGGGPRDIIDLKTGGTIATLPNDFGSYPNWQLTPVWDDSGDMIWTKPILDASGEAVSYHIERVDPTDLSNPKWTTPLAATKASLSVPNFYGSGLVPIEYLATGQTSGWMNSLLDLDTGALSHQSVSAAHIPMSRVIIEYRDQAEGTPHTIAALDQTTGETLWSMPFELGDSISEARATTGRPGWLAGGAIGTPSGDLVLTSPSSLVRIDIMTGEVKMRSDITHCGVEPWYWANGGRDVVSDPERNSLALVLGPATCSVDRDSGAPTPIADHDSFQWPLFGPEVTYLNTASINGGGSGTAYDRRTGAQLWTSPTVQDEEWFFAGGVLVRQVGTHIESLG
ncbi:outer membrane protein assembly factor BamB family protein [Leifsonia sp. 22587]|uniref:outer membrane protein assembly factor BamB family protein n=1 Tax=Leifsonia sp. 22587 TaxID=3453946 RepID=UPI003F871077